MPIKLLLTYLFIAMSITTIDAVASEQSPNMPDIIGLASPIRLNADTTTLRLADYFMDISRISGIESPDGAVKIDWQRGAATALLTATTQLLPLSVLRISTQNNTQYDILLQRSRKVTHSISFPDEKSIYKTVEIAGGFNNWNPKPNPLVKTGNTWQTKLIIDPGVYQYKMVIDGNWILDPYNPDSADNNIGGFNSVLTVNGGNTNKPIATIESISNGKIILHTDSPLTVPFLFWNNQRLPLPAPKMLRKKISYQITLPNGATQLKRSWLRLYHCNQTQAGSDQLIPLEYGKMISNTKQLTRDDKETTIMYFLMIDRFEDSDTATNMPVKDARVLPPANYMGGDFGGITKHINNNYFSNLGINTIWVSPITQNAWGAYQEYPEPRRWFSGYHGYWPISNNTVEKRFGTASDFSNLVTNAHQKNINVILDLVANHVHEEHPIYKQHPDWATPINLPDGRKNIRLWDEQRLTTWFDTFLPTLDYEKPEVVQFMVDSSLYWIKNFGIDGFRHDATKHIPNVFWQTLTQKLKQEIIVPKQKNILQIGETYGSRELIGNYVGSGQMDGQFDFNLYFDARAVFALDNEPFTKLQNSLQESLDYYGHHSLMGNISGNHDMARFNSYASEALRFDENAKEAGWLRTIEAQNEIGYQKTAMLLAFIATIPGIPVLYYGDEIGMVGGDDPDNRRPMKFDNLSPNEWQLKQTTAQLFKLRQNNMALLYGNTQMLTCTNTLWAYSRQYSNEKVIIAFNKGKQNTTLKLPTSKNNWIISASNLPEHKNEKLTNKKQINLAPYSFVVLTQVQP